MENSGSQRIALLGILLTSCAYIVFVLLTDWENFGLEPHWPVSYLRYTIARLSATGFWFILAALLILLRHRKQPVNWRSFSYAFAATGIASLILLPVIADQAADIAAIAGSVLFYALASGFLCVTVRNPRPAAVLGLTLFVLQFAGDMFVQLFTGVFRFQ
jgi:hypothetical protein